jgi:hypothetical protein
MAMGRKKARQEALWIATEELARTGGHVFYERVNRFWKNSSSTRSAKNNVSAFIRVK